MADREINKMSEFEDQGWASMSNILDKEMPIRKKKKRGVIYWWIGSAAAAIILIISIFSINQNDISKTKDKNTAHTPNATESPIDPKNEIASNNIFDKTTSPIQTNQTAIEEIIVAKNKIITESKVDQTSNNSKTLKGHTTLPNEQSNTDIALVKRTNNESKKAISRNNISFPQAEHSTISTTLDISKIHSIDLKSLNIAALPSNRIPTTFNNISKWNLAIDLSSSYSTDRRYLNTEIGIRAIKKINQNTNWVSSLGYTFRPDVFTVRSDQTAEDLLADPIASAVAPIPIGEETVFNQSLHFINLTSGINYNINRRWRTGIKLSLGYLLINEEKTNEIETVFTANRFSLNRSQLQKIGIHSGVNLGYQLTPKLSLVGEYRYLINKEKELTALIPHLYSNEISLTAQYLLD